MLGVCEALQKGRGPFSAAGVSALAPQEARSSSAVLSPCPSWQDGSVDADPKPAGATQPVRGTKAQSGAQPAAAVLTTDRREAFARQLQIKQRLRV